MKRQRPGLTILVVLALGLASPVRAQEPIKFGRTPDISPDGRQIAFSYLGDIWMVEAIGGVARPVTSHEAHDILPAFSPDGKHLAFSSNRHGSYDVFVVPIQGGRPKRLTFDSANDIVCGWAPDGKSILFTSRRTNDYPPVDDIYTIPVSGGREHQLTRFEGREGSLSPDGSRLAYVRGPGSWYRKNYRGSANNDLWICNADGSENRQLTNFDGNDSYPMWSADGKTIYYVSEHFGPANVCKIAADGEAKPEAVTHQKKDGVRRARISRNGEWIVYECGSDIWLCSTKEGGECRKIAIEAYADDKSNPETTTTFTQNITQYVLSSSKTPSPDQYVAFVVHGEIFMQGLAAGAKTVRLTEHPSNDHSPAWSPDLKKLLFLSDRGGEDNVYVLESDEADKPELFRASKFKVTRLTKNYTPEAGASFSPDGKLIAFLRDGKLWTMNPDGSNAKVVVEQTRVVEYEWSPDSKWLVYSRLDGDFASELYLVPAAGGKPQNITRYNTRNFGISWTADGKKLTFLSQRRNDLDVFVLNMQKPVREGEPNRPFEIDLEDIHLRVDRVTSLSSDELEASMRPDGRFIAFRSNSLNSDDLWLATPDGRSLTRLTIGNTQPSRLEWTRNGSLLFLDGSGALRFIAATPLGTLPPAPAQPTDPAPGRVNVSAKMRIHREEVFEQMFEQAWSLLRHRFYDPKLHDADWDEVRMKYRPLIKHVSMSEDFHDLVSLMLGELNASHLGIGGRSRGPEEQTADLGLLFEESYRGPGLKIRDILKRGPADLSGLDLKPGEYVMAINNVELNQQANVSQLLNEKAGELVTLQVAADPNNPTRKTVNLRPASRQQNAPLYYHRWVQNNAKQVADLSGGKLGYIHIAAMDLPSLDEFVRTLYSDNLDKEGIVLDVRYNGGGFTHDQVLNYLGGKEHTIFVTREGMKGMVLRANDRKYTRPLVLITNNRSYSDAEIFPNAFRSLGLGKLVGLPTGGFVIGTSNVRLIDGVTTFRVPHIGVFTVDGVNMEKAGVQPDVLVDQHPDAIVQGKDAQLEKAVEVLTKDVEVWKKNQKPPVAIEHAQPKGEPKEPGPQPGPEGK